MTMRKAFSVIALLSFIFVCSHEAVGMSKARSFFLASKVKVSSFFGRAIPSSSRCTSCSGSVGSYDGTKPSSNSELPLWALHPNGDQYTKLTLEAIDREGLTAFTPEDIDEHCPNYRNLTKEQKKTFWLQFSAQLCEMESNFRPSESYRESNGTYSNGLFSMSVGDACGIMKKWEDTMDIKKNIDCAIKTMRYQLQEKNYICTNHKQGICEYWGPLREGQQGAVVNRKYTANLPYCRLGSSSQATKN